MSGLLFLLSLVAMGVVARWAYVNDRAGPAAGTLGLLAMRDSEDEAADAPGRGDPSRWRGRSTPRAADRAGWRPRRRR